MSEDEVSCRPLHFCVVGAFGQGVAEYCRAFYPDLSLTIISDLTLPRSPEMSVSRANILVAWRPVPSLCEVLDDISHECGLPFVPVVLDSATLRVGPVVIPGRSCWDCWVRRVHQHSRTPKEDAALNLFYRSHPGAGPEGFLEPFAAMAAARIAQIIEEIKSGLCIPGYLWQINMLTREIRATRVVGVHDCRRCGALRPASTRHFKEMRREIGYLWGRG